MPIRTCVVRIDLAGTPNLNDAIEKECNIMSAGTNPMKLAAAFEAYNQLILIFQSI